MERVNDTEIISKNIINLNVYTPSKYLIKLHIDLLEFPSYNEILYYIYTHFSVLEIDRLSILLGELIFIRRDISTEDDENKSEWVASIKPENFNHDFIDKFEKFENVEYILEFNINDEYLDDPELEIISDQLIDIFIQVENYLANAQKKIIRKSFKNNVAFLKLSLEFMNTCQDKIQSIQEIKLNNENIKFIYDLAKSSISNLKEKSKILEIFLKRTPMSKKLVERCLSKNSDSQEFINSIDLINLSNLTF